MFQNASFFSLVGALVPWQRNWFDLEVCLKSWRLVLLPAAIKTMQWDTFQKELLFPSEQIWVGRARHTAPSDMVSTWFSPSPLLTPLLMSYFEACNHDVRKSTVVIPLVLSLARNTEAQTSHARCAEKGGWRAVLLAEGTQLAVKSTDSQFLARFLIFHVGNHCCGPSVK